MFVVKCGICEILGLYPYDSNNWGSGMVNHQHVWLCPECFEKRYGYKPPTKEEK